MDLIVILILTLLLAPLVAFTTGPLRIILGLLFVLFFPGYTLIAALFPRKGDLDTIVRVALSFVLSIAVVALIGLILNYTPWGITLYPILISISGLIVIASAIAFYRRHRLPEEQRLAPRLRISLPRWGRGSKLDRALSGVLLLSIIAAIGALAYVVATPNVGERFTEFYILDYPQELTLGQEATVIVGIINREYEEADYTIEVAIDGERIKEIGPITLAHEEEWEEEVTFVPTKVGDDQKVEFILYKGEEPEPYRTSHRTVDVKEAEQ